MWPENRYFRGSKSAFSRGPGYGNRMIPTIIRNRPRSRRCFRGPGTWISILSGVKKRIPLWSCRTGTALFQRFPLSASAHGPLRTAVRAPKTMFSGGPKPHFRYFQGSRSAFPRSRTESKPYDSNDSVHPRAHMPIPDGRQDRENRWFYGSETAFSMFPGVGKRIPYGSSCRPREVL